MNDAATEAAILERKRESGVPLFCVPRQRRSSQPENVSDYPTEFLDYNVALRAAMSLAACMYGCVCDSKPEGTYVAARLIYYCGLGLRRYGYKYLSPQGPTARARSIFMEYFVAL